ncbi:hypothetical protein Rsw2DRAFT_2768 [Rhodobacter ferrooxidans]|uniref:Uncharacterized protein n=1 Tax=Rhodobacter ferrooxidans TaxID=371731 RepID=C8S3Z0_9RHOB|nr:hypothetical protein Rsw2DRAFT_2768 [Rhodobacter sp. SW2]
MGLLDAFDDVLVEPFKPDDAVKAFDVGVLLGLVKGSRRAVEWSASSFDKPTISTFRATGVRFPTTALGLRRTRFPLRKCCAEFGTGRQEIAAMLGMLAAVPSPAVLALHAQQAATALARFIDFLVGAGRLNNPTGGILHKFGVKGRRAGIRCEDGGKAQGGAKVALLAPPTVSLRIQRCTGRSLARVSLPVSLSSDRPGARQLEIGAVSHARPANFQANQRVAGLPCRMPPSLPANAG